MRRLILCLVPILALAACGDLPEPFLGNPGATARRLAQPPTPRLAVPPPSDALLPDAASAALANALAEDLRKQEVPAVAARAQSTDWRLTATATQRGGMVVPVFTVRDPKDKDQGTAEGTAVPAAAWAAADPATLRQSAAEAAPKIALLLTNIETARQMADPNSLYNRRARVMVADVTGAPGDGDVVLTRQLRLRLAALGPIVQQTETNADYTVRGSVKMTPVPGEQQRVEISWLISNAAGQDLGKVVQLNQIPSGTLDRFWGDVAVVVATEASGGINDVLKRQTPGKQATQAAAQAPATSEQTPATPAQAAMPGQSPARPPQATVRGQTSGRLLNTRASQAD